MSAKSTYKATLKAGLIAAFNASKEGSSNNYDNAVIDNICDVFAEALEAYSRQQILNPTGSTLNVGGVPLAGVSNPGQIAAP